MSLRALSLLAAGAAALASIALPAQAQTHELRIAHFVTPKHPFSIWLEQQAQALEKKSGGALKFSVFPGGQMGPPPRYYDFARTGRADITWFVQGYTPGRFNLTELVSLPFLIGSAEIGTKVLNDSELRSKYLDDEHQGVRVLLLLTHQPGNIHTASKPVRTVDDMKGLRMRTGSRSVLEFVREMGGTPVGLPPTEIVDQMQKGTIDGTVLDYGGAGLAFRLGPVTRYTTEIYAYVMSFAVAINPKSYEALSPELRVMLDESFTGVEAEVGKLWDGIDGLGKKMMTDAGMEPILPAPEELARFRDAGDRVTERWLADLEEKGLPARAVHALMKELADKHAKDSHSFLK